VLISNKWTFPSRIKTANRLRFIAAEAVGSLGDIGLFIPFTIGLVQIAKFDLGTILVFTGIFNILAGLIFRLPMPIQPMKAMGAVAIAGMISSGDVAAAGIGIGLFILLTGTFGLIKKIENFIPQKLIRALMMAIAVELIFTAIKVIVPNLHQLLPVHITFIYVLVFTGLIVTVIVFRDHMNRLTCILLVIGIVWAIFDHRNALPAPAVTLWKPTWILHRISSCSNIVNAVLIQLPVTMLNSVLAVSLLAGQLYPQLEHKTTTRKIAISVGLMNLISCPFGSIPVCHGSGGLAAQHCCGARTGWSMVILGTTKIVCGVFFGVYIMYWLQIFPAVVLATFLFVAGTKLVELSKCWKNDGLFISILIIATHQLSGSLLIGFAAGSLVYTLMQIDFKISKRVDTAAASYLR